MLFRLLAGGLAARLAGYGAIGLGFWLLYQGFEAVALSSGIGWGVGGGALILAGMYFLVVLGRLGSSRAQEEEAVDQQEVSPSDPVHGRNQGG